MTRYRMHSFSKPWQIRYLHCPFPDFLVTGEKLHEVQVLAVGYGQLLAGPNQTVVQLLPHLLDEGAQVADKGAGNGAITYMIISQQDVGAR